MNAGLANLDTLRKLLLPAVMASDTQFDLELRTLGLGVADMFEGFCKRKFQRVVNDLAVFQADRASFVLPRYPVEQISLVELKLKDSDAFQRQDLSFIESTNLAAGLVFLPDNADAAPYWGEVRFTYTGGFWWETLEPDDEGYPSGQPAGSMKLPGALLAAWHLQCHHIWDQMDKLGMNLVEKAEKPSSVQSLEMSPMVRQMLQPFVRYQPA